MIELQPDLELTTGQAERLLEAWLAEPAICTEIRSMQGGLVNTVLELEFDRPPHQAVIKLHGAGGDTFGAEARGLAHLRAETACPVPEVYLHDSSGELIPHAFLLLERLPGVCLDGLDLEPAARADIDAQLAAVLGDLHDHTGTTWGGLGTEAASSEWADVFVARLVEARGQPPVGERLTAEVLARVDEAIDLAGPALHDSGGPTLIHGDVWDGNLMVRFEDGRWRLTGLLDPDVQFADVELELAYLEVFDVRRDAFFAAYGGGRRLRPGYEQRRLFYWLHTALVHVGLFGDDFFCQFTARTVEQIARLAEP